MPEVSIIIPFYDNLNLLLKAVKSVRDQLYKNYEIIFINDNPKKKHNFHSIKKLTKGLKTKFIKNKINIGAGLSRNKGIKIAKGKFIAFLDSDDIWNKDKLLYQIRYMKKKKLFITHTSYEIININNEYKGSRIAKNIEYKELINSCDIGLSTVIIKKEILKKNFFPKIKTKEDYVLWLQLTKKNFKFYGIKKKLSKWTDRKDSLSKAIFQKLLNGFKVYYCYEQFSFLKSVFKLIILSLNYIKKKI